MREMFEKIKVMLAEQYRKNRYGSHNDEWNVGIDQAEQIVNEVAAEYNNGWLLCSERLPEDLNDKNIDCFLVTDGFLIWMAYYNSETGWQFAECTNSRNKIDWTEIIAWQPLPSVWKGENNG